MGTVIGEFSFGDLRFDWTVVLKEHTKLKLTTFERRILEYIVIRRPAEVTVVALAKHLYDREPSLYDRLSIYAQLTQLRKKLKAVGTNVAICSLGNNQTRRYVAQVYSQAAE